MEPYPLFFHPVLKQTIWGGRRLGQRLGKPIGDGDDYAESWEVVDHGDDQSVVVGGELDGQTLAGLIENHGDWLLGHRVLERQAIADRSQTRDLPESGRVMAADRFPLLLKYLDCNRVLSVQVHPDDAYAMRMSPPDFGKTEAWYVVDAEPGSLIYAGLKQGVDRKSLQQAVDTGQTEQVLHSFEAHAGDVVFIPAGTVHALGAGLLITEIQQSSDTTFRLFDWNRVTASGVARPLHIEQSLEVADYESGPVRVHRVDPFANGWQRLVECDKFFLRGMTQGESLIAGDGEFHLITVPQGAAILQTPTQRVELASGSTVMLPAAMGQSTVAVGQEGESSVVLAMGLPKTTE